MKLKIGFLAAVVSVGLLCLVPSLQAQPGNFGDLGKLPKLGDVRAITNLDESHLAVWYGILDKNAVPSYWDVLAIYAVKDGEFSEVFRLKSEAGDEFWAKLVPLCDSRLIGVALQTGVITNYDQVRVIALVEGKFQSVFEGSTSEFTDLNDDGVPEIFESDWPDGDGYPTTTTVHLWNGKKYSRLMKISFRKRFGPTVQTAIARRSVPR